MIHVPADHKEQIRYFGYGNDNCRQTVKRDMEGFFDNL